MLPTACSMNQLPGPILRAMTAFSSDPPQMSTADARESGNQEMGPKLEPLSTLVLMPTSRGPAPGSSQVMATFWFEKSASCSATSLVSRTLTGDVQLGPPAMTPVARTTEASAANTSAAAGRRLVTRFMTGSLYCTCADRT